MSNLKLDELGVFKEFYGKITDQMPKFMEENRKLVNECKGPLVLLNTAGLMKRKVEVLTASEEIRDAWWNNYFDTGDAIIYHPDGKFKIVLNAEFMKELNPQSKLKGKALILPEGIYGKVEGKEFTTKEVDKYGIMVGTLLLSRYEAKNNPIWKALAREDQALLDAYVDAVFTQTQEQYGYEKPMMGIGVSQPRGLTVGRLWSIFSFDDHSFAMGNYDMGYNLSRLVGVAPKAP